MNPDLANYWAELCLMPHNVKKEMRNKFVACLMGDEIADDNEFEEFSKGMCGAPCGSGDGCKWKYQGSCFHPFRPGNIGEAIFSSVFRNEPNAESLVNNKVVDSLDNRRCHECVLKCSEDMIWRSAFDGMGRLYDHMLQTVESHHTLYGRSWEDFRKGFSYFLDGKKYFEHGDFAKYEKNIRNHFEKMAERHYHELESALSKDYKDPEDMIKAISKVRFELATHFMTYWDAEGYKNAEA